MLGVVITMENSNIQLLGLLKSAKENIPFYAEALEKCILKDVELDIFEVLDSIPIIEKKYIKKDYKKFVSTYIWNDKCEEMFYGEKDFSREEKNLIGEKRFVTECTSGTSGTPFMCIKSQQERFLLGKKMWRLRNSIMDVSPKQMFSFMHSSENSFPNFKTEDAHIRTGLELEYLMQSVYSWWHIYPRKLNNYYEYLHEENKVFKGRLKVIETNGAYVSAVEKEQYEKCFNSKLVNNYGCREVWTIAYDCGQGYMHINEEAVYVELVDENNKLICGANQVGYIVVTSLLLKSMPFIRYKTGDMGYFIAGECRCGCKGKRIVIEPNRSKILGTNLYGNTIFKEVVAFMNQVYDVTQYETISIGQYGDNYFKVFIWKNLEPKTKIENAFIESTKFFLKMNKLEYEFVYDSKLEAKSLFFVGMKEGY
jgi:phenylacetate-CoA ligase